MADNFIIQYPDTGSKGSLAYGRTNIDFWEGVVTDSAGTQTTLKRSLKNSNQEYIRSLAIFVSQGGTIQLGVGESVKSYLSHYGWNVFENINVKEIDIELFTAGVPDVNEILVIGSTSSKSIYNPQDVIFHAQDTKTLASINTEADIILKVTDRFKHHTFVLTEDGTNSITYYIYGKMTGPSAWVKIQDATVLDSDTDIIQIEGSWSMLKATIKSTVGAAHGNVLAQWSGIN